MSGPAHVSPDLLSTYVLGAADEDEAHEVRVHLAGCVDCALALERLRPTREALLGAAPARQAPAHLKRMVMAEVRREGELFAAARAPTRTAATTRPRWWERLLSPLPAGAALAACLALLAGAVLVGPGREPPSAQVRYGEVDASRAPGGDARLETAAGSVRLRVAGLPAAGRGRQYQVWLRTARRPPRPARALFSVDARGAGSVVLPAGTGAADAVLVTAEPRGGSDLPSSAPILEIRT